MVKIKDIMKRIYYALIALAAVAVVSCAKEEFGNNAPETPAGLVFTVQSETVAKSVLDENVTPEWVAGDVISVNGTSCALLDAAAGTFDGANVETAESYSAVYPYAVENVFTGTVLSASVPAEQTIAAGQNVAAGALVAACISDDITLKFKNCVSLMQIDLPVEGVKEIVITVDGETEVLAGPFTMDLAAETLAPVAAAEGTSKTVTLKPAEGTFAPGTYYAAVLPGTFSGFSVKFIKSEEDTQTIASTKELLLERSSGKTLGTIFTYNIGSAEELLSWAKNNAKYTAWDVVNLTADIALTAEQAAAYVESNDFCGTFNGNNKKITGLTTPLFGNLRGIVKNVDITANIVHNGKANTQFKGTDYGLGILAHYMYNDKNASASVSGVTVRGSVKVSGLSVTHNYYLGGMVGSSNGVPVSGCKNYAVVETENSSAGTAIFHVGGIAGFVQTANLTLSDCENHGELKINTTTSKYHSVGGVFGSVNTYEFAINNCDNYAPVSIASTVTGNDFASVAGVLGSTTGGAKVTMTGCDNRGAVTNACTTAVTTQNKQFIHTAGVAGYLAGKKSTLSNCTNSAVIWNKTTNTNGARDKGARHMVAGIVAHAVADKPSTDLKTRSINVTGCKNSGAIKCEADKACMLLAGGIAGFNDNYAYYADCENSGEVTSTSAGGYSFMSGIVARLNLGGLVDGCENLAAGQIKHSGSILGTLRMGGIVGNFICGKPIDNAATPYGIIQNSTNAGAILNESPTTCENTSDGYADMGGILGGSQSNATYVIGCENTGSVGSNVTGGKTLRLLRIGGIAGYMGNSGGKVDTCTSNCAVSSEGTVTTANAGILLGHCGTTSTFTLSGNKVAGSVLGTVLTADNYSGLLGTKSGGSFTVSDNSLLQ